MTYNEARDELRRILLVNENDEFLDVEIPGALAKLRRKKSRALAWMIATTLFHDQLGKLTVGRLRPPVATPAALRRAVKQIGTLR